MRPSIHGRFLVACALFAATASAHCGDWPRFRGPNGAGVPDDGQAPPVEWSDTQNLKWKTALPGPGISSPIVVGDRVFVTCWSGYAVGGRDLGNQEDLKRHLVCVDRGTGTIRWSSTVAAVLPEDRYGGMFAECGYAAHTPVSDGERVYAFFGKSGVVAYDMGGNELWRKSVGTGRDGRGWGTASSPILFENLLIVPAAIEGHALVAFDKVSGEQAWKAEADGFASTWGSPLLVELPEGRTDLVMGVPGEIWGFDPRTGKLRWYCESPSQDSMCSSVVAHDGVVYAIEGMAGGSIAVRAGGKGDVSQSHVVWSGRDPGRISTPVTYNGRLYAISRNAVRSLDAATGKQLAQTRLERSSASGGEGRPQVAGDGRPQAGEDGRPQAGPGRGGPGRGGPGGGRPGFGGFGGGGGGFGGGMGGQDYSSPVIAADTLYYVFRSGEVAVLKLGEEIEQIGTNRFASDGGDFSASPAISDGELFIRSNTHLYCVAEGA